MGVSPKNDAAPGDTRASVNDQDTSLDSTSGESLSIEDVPFPPEDVTDADFTPATKPNVKHEPPPVPINGAPVVVCMADVEAKPIDWLWPDRFPRGMVSVLAGLPGVGKSFLTADMAARLSTGTAWPDGSPCPLGDVLLVAGEDDPSTIVRPRLDAHGADVNRVHLLSGVMEVRNGKRKDRMFSLSNLDALEKTLIGLPNLALVVIDPIGSFLGGGVNSDKDNQVREVMAPLAGLAEKYRVAILVVAHHNKSSGGKADDLVMGSRAFTGLARCVYHLMAHPEDTKRPLLLPGKTNVSHAPKGLAFRIGGDPPRLEWESAPVDLQADDVLAASREMKSGGSVALGRAIEWLRHVLFNGRVLADEVMKQAKADGISPRTLARAKRELKVKYIHADGFQGGWMWELPHTLPSVPKDANPEDLAHNGEVGTQWQDDEGGEV